jgi:DNA (cytosine-5)-methyltransferase 1
LNLNNMKYKWYLEDIKNIKSNWLKVFSFFSCWWWSSMGYKNAWYEVFGWCDIDKQMIEVYKKNLNPKIMYWDWIIEFNKTDNKQIPLELFNLDILDWSPPCSTFSIAWEREKNWGKDKKFREWQQKQVLDDLVFEYIRSVDKLKPKVFILENVSWIIKGKAKWYAKEIVKQAKEIWYNIKVFLLNWATMGLPQARERVFFIWVRKDIWENNLQLNFNEKPIKFKDIKYNENIYSKPLTWKILKIWNLRKKWDNNLQNADFRLEWKRNFFNHNFIFDNKVPNTITANCSSCLYNEPRYLNKIELQLIWSFPFDYNFNWIKPDYLIWMSVPPLMIYKIAKEIQKQIFNNFTP